MAHIKDLRARQFVLGAGLHWLSNERPPQEDIEMKPMNKKTGGNEMPTQDNQKSERSLEINGKHCDLTGGRPRQKHGLNTSHCKDEEDNEPI